MRHCCGSYLAIKDMCWFLEELAHPCHWITRQPGPNLALLAHHITPSWDFVISFVFSHHHSPKSWVGGHTASIRFHWFQGGNPNHCQEYNQFPQQPHQKLLYYQQALKPCRPPRPLDYPWGTHALPSTYIQFHALQDPLSFTVTLNSSVMALPIRAGQAANTGRRMKWLAFQITNPI